MGSADRPLVVRVLPDPPALAKEFDYLVPEELRDEIAVGSEVRVDLHGRRVGGWVTAIDVAAPAGVSLRRIAKLRGIGPAADVVELARWAAWRWAGRPANFLTTASPTGVVRVLPPAAALRRPSSKAAGDTSTAAEVADGVFAAPDLPTIVRIAPCADRLGVLRALLDRALAGSADPLRARSALVVAPEIGVARQLTARLERAGLPVAHLSGERTSSAAARQWALAAAGGRVVVGARAAAFGPAPDLALGIVLDEHAEAHQSERAPTWHARDVVVERCRRAGAPAVLLSPCPSLDALAHGRLVAPPRAVERDGWPVVELVDRRHEDPHLAASLISERLASLVRGQGRVVCVLNRTGRARLLACRACGELARCGNCGASVAQHDDRDLHCGRCGSVRPSLCAACGSTALKLLRPGINRLREELAALAGEPVLEVSGRSKHRSGADPATARLVVGTEAALHRVGRCDAVVFCDFDQELLAPRYRSGEDALALLVRGARLVGARRAAAAGRLVVQTRLPGHPVLQTAVLGDPAGFAAHELTVRQALAFPPVTALATLRGPGAGAAAAEIAGVTDPAVEVVGADDDLWLLRAPSHDTLCDALAAMSRPAQRVRIEVDPRRI